MPRSVAGQRQVVRDFGTCLLFNGATNIVKRANVSTVTNNFTIMAWVNPSNQSNSQVSVFHNGIDTGGAGGNGFCIELRNGTVQALYSDVAHIDSTKKYRVGIWQHIAITRNAGTTRIYINGVDAGITNGSAPKTPTNFLTVGCDSDSGTTLRNNYVGLVDECMIFERVLTSTEILNYVYGIDLSSSNIKVFYKFDEGSGSSTTDSSGNSNTGTITDATYSTNVFMKPRTASGTRTLVDTRSFMT